MTKRILLYTAMIVVLIFSTISYGQEKAPEGLYSLSSDTGNYQKFSNFVHGYSLKIPTNVKIDMSMSAVCAVIENEDLRIEVYKQPLQQGISLGSYQNYSNKFLQNTLDHKKEYQTVETIGGKTVHVLQYSRKKLARIKNDKNYYANLDVISGNVSYSIFVKSTKPFWEIGGYHYLVEDFQVFTPTATPYVRTTQPVDLSNRGWNDETASIYSRYFSDDSPLTWGIFEPAAPETFSELDRIEGFIDYKFPFLLNYTSFDNKVAHSGLSYRLENAYKHGKILELTLQTPGETWGEGNMVYDVLDGEYDAFLADYAKSVSEFKHPVLFRLGNEMNGDWCPYSAYHTAKDTEIFKEFYKYIYEIFDKAGADNVIWVWNPNHKSFPNFQWNHELMYYPGDEYVDIVGLTAYNTGTYYKDEKWTSFETLYDEIYDTYDRQYKQPLMITEFASSSVGGDKNRWIIDMFHVIEKYDRIKVAIWWDGCDRDSNGNIARPYFIDETMEILETFNKYLNDKIDLWDVYA